MTTMPGGRIIRCHRSEIVIQIQIRAATRRVLGAEAKGADLGSALMRAREIREGQKD